MGSVSLVSVNVLLERLRTALAPQGIFVEAELESGGMGTVFRARDERLDCARAIKILRPELAGARAIERFQREARALATLTHPNIVPVHAAGFADGIPYYVMDFLSGETLAKRQDRGGLPAEDVVRLGRDILAALGAAHRHGIVHRDVKPSNIFLVEGRAVLTDFGVAKQVAPNGPGLTGPNEEPGTEYYMAPEQRAHAPVTPRSDLYSLGIVLGEALAGQGWCKDGPERADWARIPTSLRPALRRALAWSPAERWPDAESFTRALSGRSPRMPSVALAVGGLVVLAASWAAWSVWSGPVADLRIEPLDVREAGPVGALGDSLTLEVWRGLTGFPDFTVLGPSERGRARSAVTGAIVANGSGARVTLMLGQHPLTVPLVRQRWRETADRLVDLVLADLFRGSALDMPDSLLPQAPRAFKAFLDAEKLLAAGRWAEADYAYVAAIQLDSSCLLCVWRHAEAARWVGMEDDTLSQRFLREHIGKFPPWYQTMIRVDSLPELGRLDSLSDLTKGHRDFPLGWFRYADEMMHRAPLVGRNERRAADRPLEEVLRLRPDFVPALEHLAWLKVADGDSAAAAGLLDSLDGFPPERRSPMGIQELVRMAWQWRELPAETARRRTERTVAEVQSRGISYPDAGARYLNSFDAPSGAIFLGRRLEPRFRWSGRIAQLVGWLELGRYDSAASVLRREQQDAPTPALELLRAELGAAIGMLWDATDTPAVPATAALERFAADASFPARLRARAVWMAGLTRCGPHPRPGESGEELAPLGGPPALQVLGTACTLAAQGSLQQALDITQPLTELTGGHVPDPFFRAVLHLLRSDWWLRRGRPERAIHELYWYQNTDQDRLPTLDPQPMEIDWAFGVIARWRWAAILDGTDGPVEERCRLYRDVARLWAGGEAAYAARADTARRRMAVLGCAEGNG